MNTPSIFAAAGGVLLVIYMTLVALRGAGRPQNTWLFPAVISVLFLIYSLITIQQEGVLGFWVEHTRTLWGAQVWLDLLLAIGIGWTFVVPRAKRMAMHTLPWMVVILLTGCIGLLAMVSRMLYLEERTAVPQEAV